MNITKDQFEALTKIRTLLPSGDQFNELPDHLQQIIIDYDTTLVNLYKKRKADNKRTAAYIAEKRKTNKNYAR